VRMIPTAAVCALPISIRDVPPHTSIHCLSHRIRDVGEVILSTIWSGSACYEQVQLYARAGLHRPATPVLTSAKK
jgi:hypothetical protein